MTGLFAIGYEGADLSDLLTTCGQWVSPRCSTRASCRPPDA